MKTITLVTLLLVTASVASARNIVSYRGIVCSYDKLHETFHGDKYDVNFQFNGWIEHDLDAKTIRGQHGSAFQQANQYLREGLRAEDVALLVSSSDWGDIKTYKPRNEEYKEHLGGNGYKFELSYVAANGGLGGFSSHPYSVYLYVSQKPHDIVFADGREDVADVKMNALFAIQFHDHMQPDYVRLTCVARQLTFN